MDVVLPTPSEFPAFPYSPPYEIQIQLMDHLYQSIEQQRVSIVESPTGTGKTLSLLCSSLTWLRDNKNRARQGILQQVSDGDASQPAWVIQHMQKRKMLELEDADLKYEKRLLDARKREIAARKKSQARSAKKLKLADKSSTKAENVDEDDSMFLPDNDEAVAEERDGLTPEARAILSKIEQSTKPRSEEEEEEPACVKIYYASRTHSQLTQVLPELEKLKLTNPILKDIQVTNLHDQSNNKRPASELDESDASSATTSSTRAIALGSRRQLCINEELKKKTRDIDESCREILGEKGPKRCPFLPPMDEEPRILDFRDEILATPKDIEDLATAGKIANVCPYFGSRRAIPQAELVTLPYNLLVQKNAREALGIDLTGHIVIVDEAHNLISTLLSLSTAIITLNNVSNSLFQVQAYLNKFRNRLSPVNVIHLKKLLVFLDGLKKYVTSWKESTQNRCSKQSANGKPEPKSEVITLSTLTERLGRNAASVNLLEIEVYLKKSKVARKIAGYSNKQNEQEARREGRVYTIRKGMVPPLHAVEDFMIGICGNNDDGRVTLNLAGKPGQEDVEIKYQHLNPAPLFSDVVESARSVILAGGTMSPMSDVIAQLFPDLGKDKIATFSCGHIIPEANLKPIVVSKGPRGSVLEYKAGKQNDPSVLQELGQILVNFSNVVPAGLVVFFPSYVFLRIAKKAWVDTVLPKLETKKQVFFEPDDSADVEKVLREYAAAARSPPTPSATKGGALLFAVINAKLSEGLNFLDELARGVVIIGMPFANLGSPELQERMKYVNRLQAKAGKASGVRDASEELYENMCMNGVNQSIGRAIRHRGDWASLILLDRRYETGNIRKKLPSWIGGSLVVTQTFGQVMKELGGFYSSKKWSARISPSLGSFPLILYVHFRSLAVFIM